MLYIYIYISSGSTFRAHDIKLDNLLLHKPIYIENLGVMHSQSSNNQPSQDYSLEESSSSTISRGSRGSSRAGSKKEKRKKKINDHVPLTYLLGKKYAGYQTEISNYPQAQPQHKNYQDLDSFLPIFSHQQDGEKENGRTRTESDSFRGYDSSSYTSSVLQGDNKTKLINEIDYNSNWINEPILSEALSRAQREQAATSVLLGKRTLLPNRRSKSLISSSNSWSTRKIVEDNNFELNEELNNLNGGRINTLNSLSRGGARPTTTSSSSCMSPETLIVPFVHDPRYPRTDAPVAQKDFLKVTQSGHLMPWSYETKLDAIEAEKLRLINKSFATTSATGVYKTQQEELAVRREQKMVSVQRIRRAIHRAHELSIEKMKEELSLTKIKLKKNKEQALEQVREKARSKRKKNLFLKKVVKDINDMRGGKRYTNDTSFGQCFRTVANGAEGVRPIKNKEINSHDYLDTGASFSPLIKHKVVVGFKVKKAKDRISDTARVAEAGAAALGIHQFSCA